MYSIYRIIIIYKICKHLHAKLAIQKSVNVFLSPWHQLWQYSGKLFSSCICYHIIEPPSVKWLASAKNIPATIKVNLKITIKTRCSMLTCVAPLAQVDPRPWYRLAWAAGHHPPDAYALLQSEASCHNPWPKLPPCPPWFQPLRAQASSCS